MRLTPRQKQCLRAYIATGSMKEAAVALRISEQTVKNHLAAIHERLGGVTSVQAAYLAGAAGWKVTVQL